MAKLTTQELSTKVSVKAELWGGKITRTVSEWLECREKMINLPLDTFYNNGYDSDLLAIDSMLNLRFGKKWWSNHG